MCQSVEKVVCTAGNYEEERRFEKLSDQSEVLLHNLQCSHFKL